MSLLEDLFFQFESVLSTHNFFKKEKKLAVLFFPYNLVQINDDFIMIKESLRDFNKWTVLWKPDKYEIVLGVVLRIQLVSATG